MVATLRAKGCRIYWTNSCSIGVEWDLIFGDRPVSSELIFQPEPSTTKDPQPTPTDTIPPGISKPPDTQSPKSEPLSGNPLAPLEDSATPSEPAKDESPSTSSELPPNAAEIGPPTRTSRRVQRPSPYVRELMDATEAPHEANLGFQRVFGYPPG